VVFNDHKVANTKLWVDASGRIGQQQGSNPECGQSAHRKGYRCHIMAFVKMRSATQ
jgi:hypothetical protein